MGKDSRADGPRDRAQGQAVGVVESPCSLVFGRRLPLASEPASRVRSKGVELTVGLAPGSARYRIFRAEADGQPQRIADTAGPRYVDETTGFGTRYRYIVQAIAGENQWSHVSEAAEITPADTFPPAVPEGLSAVPTPQSIELAWTRNTETDFRGYNIFRSVDGGPFEKIASLIEVPTFSDSKIEAGKKYRYAVSAVDLTGNESVRSAPVEAAGQ